MVVEKESPQVGTRALSFDAYLSAEGLKSDFGGFYLVRDGAYEKRRRAALRAVTQEMEKLKVTEVVPEVLKAGRSVPAKIGLTLGGSLMLMKNPIVGGLMIYVGVTDTVGYAQEPGQERNYLSHHLESVVKALNSMLTSPP